MWHEARRQEKLVRSKMVDSAKRHERRKVFYESIRREPEEFMQIHGRRATIHMDASLATAAEASNILRKWQGDSNVLIDRFDARSHLDHISEPIGRVGGANSSVKQLLLDDAQELQCEYERYRILIFNEYLKVSERNWLSQIAAKEFWPSMSNAPNIHRVEHENKRKAAEKKAAIGFTYADSTGPSTRANTSAAAAADASDESSESDDADELDDIDMKFNVDELSPEQGAQLNKIGARYRIGGGVFLKLLRLDYTEQDNNAQIKEIDKAKLALSGRQAKADRAVLKRRRAMIVGKVTQNEEATTTLLSFLANAKRNADENLIYFTSSESEDDAIEKTEFITSFGDDDNEDDDNDTGVENRAATRRNGGGGTTAAAGPASAERVDDDDAIGANGDNVVQGPILPNKEYRRLLELKHRRSNSPDEIRDPFASSRRRRSRTRSRSRSSRDRYHERRGRHARGGDYSRDSVSRHYRASSRASRRASGRRSRSRERERDSKGRQRDERRGISSSAKSSPHVGALTAAATNAASASVGATTTGANRIGGGASPAESNRASDASSGADSPLTIRSSMSDSEKEQLEIENRKRRIRRIKREMRTQSGNRSGNGSAAEIGGDRRRVSTSGANGAAADPTTTTPVESHKAALAKKLRQQMQKTLRKTAEQLKHEEEERAREQYKERRQREEELLEESRILRQREREKLRLEDEEAASQRERDRLRRRAAERERDREREKARDREPDRDRNRIHRSNRRRSSS